MQYLGALFVSLPIKGKQLPVLCFNATYINILVIYAAGNSTDNYFRQTSLTSAPKLIAFSRTVHEKLPTAQLEASRRTAVFLSRSQIVYMSL